MRSKSVRLTVRESSCTTPHGLHCLAHVLELTEVVFSEVTVLVCFEVNSNLLDVRHLNVRRLARVGETAIFVFTFKTFARVRDTERFGQFLREYGTFNIAGFLR